MSSNGKAIGDPKTIPWDAYKDARGRFTNGNPGGQRGRRWRFGETVTEILQADFIAHHEQILARLRTERPWEWLRLMIWHLRGYDRGDPVDETGFMNLHTKDEVVAAIRHELGDDAADALLTMLETKPKALAKRK